jgi:hypothetical protein
MFCVVTGMVIDIDELEADPVLRLGNKLTEDDPVLALGNKLTEDDPVLALGNKLTEDDPVLALGNKLTEDDPDGNCDPELLCDMIGFTLPCGQYALLGHRKIWFENRYCSGQ